MSNPITDDTIISQIKTISTNSPTSIKEFREGLPVSIYSRIVEICIYYEKTWTPERIFSIEEGLKLVSEDEQKESEDEQRELFERLYEIDLLYGYSHRAVLPLTNYQKRFPQYEDAVRATYDRVSKESVAINTDRIGKKIEHYRIEGIIGKGGMGVVYKAFDEPFDRYVAIKYLLPRFADFKDSNDRFLHEIKLMGQLPSDIPFAHAYYYGRDDKVSYLVMEYVEGIDLGAYVNKKNSLRKSTGPLSWQEALGYVKQVAEGLKCIHQINIIHHDIKPENIIVNKDGKIKILDLGLGSFLKPAKNIPTLENSDKEAKKSLEGTPAYLPPEIFKDPDNAGCQSDIYCLGGTFFYLISGQLPIHWYNPQVETSLIPSKSLKTFLNENHIKKLPDSVFEILQKMLEPDCNRRYQSAKEICSDIDKAIKNEQRSYWQNRKYSILLHIFLLTAVLLASWIFGGNYYYYAKSIIEIQGDNPAAMPIIQKVRDKLLPPQKRSDFLLKRAMFYNRNSQGNTDTIKRSKEDFSRYLKIIPTDYEALIQRAGINLTLNCPTEARQDLQLISRLETKNVSLLIKSAKMSEILKDFNKAQKFLDKAAELKPKGVDIKLLKAQIYVKNYESNPIMTDYLDKAIDCLVSALKIDKNNKSLYYELAKTYLIYPEISPGEIKVFKSQILANLEKAIQLDPTYIEATSLRADYYFKRQKNYQNAAEDYITLLSLLKQPGVNEVYINLANCFDNLHLLEKSHFVTALAINEQIEYQNQINPQYQFSEEVGMMIEKYNRHIDFILKTSKRDFSLGKKHWQINEKQRLIIEINNTSNKAPTNNSTAVSQAPNSHKTSNSTTNNSSANKPALTAENPGQSVSNKPESNPFRMISPSVQPSEKEIKTEHSTPANGFFPRNSQSAKENHDNRQTANSGSNTEKPSTNSPNHHREPRSDNRTDNTASNKSENRRNAENSTPKNESPENTAKPSRDKQNSSASNSPVNPNKPADVDKSSGNASTNKEKTQNDSDNPNKTNNSSPHKFSDEIIFDPSQRAKAEQLFKGEKKSIPPK